MLIRLIAILAAASTSKANDCNPLYSHCPAIPALGKSQNFTVGSSLSEGYFDIKSSEQNVQFTPNGCQLLIENSGQNPYLQSKFYIMFGRVELIVKPAHGLGVVSSLVLQSQVNDEIDLEFLGHDLSQVYTSYLSQGDGLYSQRVETIDEAAGTLNCTVDWDSRRIEWYVNDQLIREVKATAVTAGYPQTPMNIKLGMWAAGDLFLNSPETVDWAGGPINFRSGPFSMLLDSIAVTDFSTGHEYFYKRNDGKWQSIESVGGRVNPCRVRSMSWLRWLGIHAKSDINGTVFHAAAAGSQNKAYSYENSASLVGVATWLIGATLLIHIYRLT